MSSFKDLRIVDNFYQTSSFFPMPTVLVGTVSENGQTNLGAYSICFPYYIAGKERYAMLLECRNSSNTAQNILRGSKVSLNFITDDRKYFREAVRLGFPGDTTEEKIKFGAHFILKVDKILMKEKYYNSIVNGVKAKNFPPVPVDYGYRDSTNFWCSSFKKPFPEKIRVKEGDVNSVKYAAKRIDPEVTFTDEACAKLTKIPRIFLKAALTQMVEIAKEENVSVIDEAALQIINDKRRKEKR